MEPLICGIRPCLHTGCIRIKLNCRTQLVSVLGGTGKENLSIFWNWIIRTLRRTVWWYGKRNTHFRWYMSEMYMLWVMKPGFGSRIRTSSLPYVDNIFQNDWLIHSFIQHVLDTYYVQESYLILKTQKIKPNIVCKCVCVYVGGRGDTDKR